MSLYPEATPDAENKLSSQTGGARTKLCHPEYRPRREAPRNNRGTCCLASAQPLPHFARGNPRHANDLIPAGLAARNGNGTSRHLQKFCEKFNAGIICTSPDRGRSQRYFQGIANFAADDVFLRAGMHSDREANAVAVLSHRNHQEPSKITIVVLSVAKDLCRFGET
jgi:hypothetical protein